LRILVTIGGVVAAIVVAALIWMLIPKSAPAPVANTDASSEATLENPADGSLRVCNQTGNRVSIALGYRADKGWQSEGWWVAEPGKCVPVYRGNLEARRYYYIYAADDIGGGAWDGKVFMCTRDETFTIFDVDNCLARGYERTGFFEIDTGNRPDWTLQLTDAPAEGDEADQTGTDDIPLDGEGTTVVPQGTDDSGAQDLDAQDLGAQDIGADEGMD
jgi:uncharacterized membrane protein